MVDSGPLVALGDRRDDRQAQVQRMLARESGTLVVPLPVATEVDHILGRRGGPVARLAFIDDLAAGRFLVECLSAAELTVVAALERRYSDLDVGLADLSVVVLADRHGTDRIATFDHRDFRVLRRLDGGVFRLLPQDSEPDE